MSPHRLTSPWWIYLCIFPVLAFLTSCQYQPSSPERTEIPLYIPPTQGKSTPSPALTPSLVKRLPSETATLNPPTQVSQEIQDCQFATDPEYGFSEEAPIQVGSNHLSDGPERELIYLLTLRGPNGEEVFYTRQTPLFNQAGTIVDPYLVEYEGIKEPLTLYFDLYNYSPLLVPAGFTCEAPFPIQPPQE